MPTLSELLISNPRGWGVNPPAQVYDGDITNALDPRADYIGQKFGPEAGALAQRLLNAGVHVRDTAKGFAKGFSGIGMAEEAGENLAHAVDRGDPIGAAGSVAQAGLAALPAAGRFAEPLIRTTPRLASLLMTAGAAPVAASGLLAPSKAEAKPIAKAPRDDAPVQAPPTDNGLSADQNARLIQLQKDVARGNWRTGAERRSKESELRQLQDLSADYSRNRNATATEAARIEATAKAQREADAAAAEQKAAEEKAALDQPFQARHPTLATALALGAPAASGVLAATGLGRVANKGKSLLAELLQAREAGDVLKMTERAASLDKWQKNAPMKQALAIGVPSTLPADARAMGDLVDRYSLPNTSKAQNEADERLSDPVRYAKDAIPAIASGLVFGGVGSKFAPSAPRGEAKAMLSLYGNKDAPSLSAMLREGAAAGTAAQPALAAQDAAMRARASGAATGRLQPGSPEAELARSGNNLDASTRSERLLSGTQAGSGRSGPAMIEAKAEPSDTAPAAKQLGGSSASSEKASSHHSILQPRNKKGRFSGPPKRPNNDE